MEVRFQLELFAHTDETDLTHEQLSDLSEHIVETVSLQPDHKINGARVSIHGFEAHSYSIIRQEK